MTEEITKEDNRLIKNLEIGIMCMTLLYAKYIEEKPNLGPIGDKEIRDAHKTLCYLYKEACDDLGFKNKSLEEIAHIYSHPKARPDYREDSIN